MHGGQQRVAIEQFQVSGQLLNPINFSTPLDFDCHRNAIGVSTHQVNRTNSGRKLSPNQFPSPAEGGHVLGEQFLQVCFNAIFDKPWINAEFVLGLVQHLIKSDD